MRAIEVTTGLSMHDAEAAIRASLAAEGFGVLTEIDIAATLRTKIGVERPAMKILGACNPHFAHRALQFDESVSLMLPCNVVLSDTGHGTKISIADPRELMSDEAFHDLAQDAAEHLEAAIGALPVA
jgi:uncharacterized protein (DUF302 family)